MEGKEESASVERAFDWNEGDQAEHEKMFFANQEFTSVVENAKFLTPVNQEQVESMEQTIADMKAKLAAIENSVAYFKGRVQSDT